MRFIRSLRVAWFLGACLSGSSFAQCYLAAGAVKANSGKVPATVGSGAGQRGQEDRTVLLDLVVRKSGAVRDAKVISGPATLRAAAIKAAKKRGHEYQFNVWPSDGHITVEVKFFGDNAGSPQVRQVLPAGVPGCISAPHRVRISQAVMANRLLSRVEPVYQPEAQPEHIVGVVVVRVVIDKSGGVLNADYVSGPPALVPAAVDAVKQWKYQPYLLSGEPFEVETTVEISFTL
jgi:TonB family protein